MQPAELTARTRLLSAQAPLFQARKPQTEIGQPLPTQAACWDFSLAMHWVFFAANHDLAGLQQVACFSSLQSPSLLLRPGPFGQLAEAGPAACPAASGGGKGCSSWLLWQGATADALGGLPQKILAFSWAGAG